MKATQLEQLAFDYMFSMDRVKTAAARIDTIKQTWSAKESRVKELEGLLREVSRQKEIRQQIRDIKTQLGWSMVEEKEGEGGRFEAEAGRKELKLTELDEARQKILDRATKIQEEIVQRQQEANAFSVELEPIQRAYDALQASLRASREDKNKVTSDLTDLNNMFKEEKKSLDRLKEQLEEELHRNDNQHQNRLLKEISELNDEIVALTRTAGECRQTEGHLKARRTDLNEQMGRAKQKLEETQHQYDARRRTLDQLRRAKGNRLSSFHDSMPQLMEDIRRNARNFHRDPVGPIGMYVQLKDRKWELPVEVLIGKELSAFIVKDHHDQDMLRGMMKKYRMDFLPIFIINSDTPLDYARGEPDARYTTALRVISISHPLVLKALLINCKLESAAFFSSRPEAKDALRNVRNVDAAFTPNDRVFTNGSSHSSNALYRSGKIGLIQDEASRIQELEAEVKTIRVRLDELQGDLKILENEAHSLGQEYIQNEQRSNNAERQIRTQKAKLFQLTEEQSSIASIGYSSVEEDIRASEEKLASLTRQYVAINEQIAAKDAQVREVEKKMKENLAQQEVIKAKADEALDELHRASTFRRNVDKELAVLEQSKQHVLSEVQLAKTRRDRVLVDIKTMSEDLTAKLGPRVRVGKARVDLEKDLSRNTTILEELMRTQPDPAELMTESTELRDSLAKSKRLVESEDQLMAKMKNTIERRQRIWGTWLKDIAKLSNMEFILMLQARGFQGKLEYDTANSLLNIRVKPQAQVASDQARKAQQQDASMETTASDNDRDIKQLSGGEKSYSTACFFFSLWTAMSSPLRALDEFDVFMDQINRDFVIGELVKNARSSRVQFILITPNSISHTISLDHDIKIIRLENPERRQVVA